MRALIPLVLVATLTAVPIAAARRDDPEAELAKLLAGRVADKPLQCISLSPNSPSTTIDRTAIVYRDGATLYVNRFDQGCPSLDRSRILVVRVRSGALCRVDIADMIVSPPGMQVGSCVFGQFTPYRKPK